MVRQFLCLSGNVALRALLLFRERKRMPTRISPEMLNACDPENAYLFECTSDPDLLAVTRSKLGSNLPRPVCARGWKLRIAFRLGIHHPVPVPVSPEPILTGIAAKGYYVWRNTDVSRAIGSSA
jgi:hypothetical protein